MSEINTVGAARVWAHLRGIWSRPLEELYEVPGVYPIPVPVIEHVGLLPRFVYNAPARYRDREDLAFGPSVYS